MKWIRPDKPRWGTRIEDLDPDAISEAVRRLRPVFDTRRSWFHTQYVGIDNVPAEPTLVVSNHSGGTSIPDVWGLVRGWYEHFDTDRPLHALAHEMVFALEATGRRFAKLGVLRADRDIALTALRQWRRDVLVLPGGDLETWRPHRDRYKVRFNGRKGYARLALEAGVPVQPVAHAGAHDTLLVLSDGRWLAEKLHFPELFRASIFPVHLSFPYGLAVGPWPHLPPPATLRYRFADPIQLDVRVPEGSEPSAAAIDELDRRVQASIQAELDVLRDEDHRVGDRLRNRLPSAPLAALAARIAGPRHSDSTHAAAAK